MYDILPDNVCGLMLQTGCEAERFIEKVKRGRIKTLQRRQTDETGND